MFTAYILSIGTKTHHWFFLCLFAWAALVSFNVFLFLRYARENKTVGIKTFFLLYYIMCKQQFYFNTSNTVGLLSLALFKIYDITLILIHYMYKYCIVFFLRLLCIFVITIVRLYCTWFVWTIWHLLLWYTYLSLSSWTYSKFNYTKLSTVVE